MSGRGHFCGIPPPRLPPSGHRHRLCASCAGNAPAHHPPAVAPVGRSRQSPPSVARERANKPTSPPSVARSHPKRGNGTIPHPVRETRPVVVCGRLSPELLKSPPSVAPVGRHRRPRRSVAQVAADIGASPRGRPRRSHTSPSSVAPVGRPHRSAHRSQPPRSPPSVAHIAPVGRPCRSPPSVVGRVKHGASPAASRSQPPAIAPKRPRR